MITKYFNVPLECMMKITEIIEDHDINNSIIGIGSEEDDEEFITIVFEAEKEEDLVLIYEMFNNGEIEEVTFDDEEEE